MSQCSSTITVANDQCQIVLRIWRDRKGDHVSTLHTLSLPRTPAACKRGGSNMDPAKAAHCGSSLELPMCERECDIWNIGHAANKICGLLAAGMQLLSTNGHMDWQSGHKYMTCQWRQVYRDVTTASFRSHQQRFAQGKDDHRRSSAHHHGYS